MRNFEKQTKKSMGYFSHSFFDPQPVVTAIVNILIDYCVRPELNIASSIINDIIGKFETESSLHSDCQLSKKKKFEWWHKTFTKTPN